MPSTISANTESITIAIDADVSAYIEQKGIKDIDAYISGLIQQEKTRQAKGQDSTSAGVEANELAKNAPNAV